jgi:hypothetical protein
MRVWKNIRVVNTGMPAKRSSPFDFAIISDDIDISATSNSANRSCRQNSSDGCSTVGVRSTPSTFTAPSMIGQVRGLEVMPMLSWMFMSLLFLLVAETRWPFLAKRPSALLGFLGAVEQRQRLETERADGAQVFAVGVE